MVLVGCGHKTRPVYVDDANKTVKKGTKTVVSQKKIVDERN